MSSLQWSSGEVFPLPVPAVEERPRAGMSRGVTQRIMQRRRRSEEVAGAVGALNWLASAEGEPHGVPSACQLDALRRVESAVETFSSVSVDDSAETVRALLRHKAGYLDDGQSGSTLRPFKKDLVALPTEAWTAPEATSVLAPPERTLLEGLLADQRRSPEELAAVPDTIPYMDPVLRHSRSAYIDFVKTLADRGLLIYRRRCQSPTALFFVAKKMDS